MALELRKGKYWKSDVKGELYKVSPHENSMRFLSILQRAGYIQIKGKIIVVKKDLTL